jgi:hypothetical protein
MRAVHYVAGAPELTGAAVPADARLTRFHDLPDLVDRLA